MEALRNLLRYANSQESENAKKIMSKFSKNYLPILFNIYTAEDQNQQKGTDLAALETARVFLPFLTKDLVETFIKSAIQKLNGTTEAEKMGKLMDILMMMTPFMDGDQMNLVRKKLCAKC